MDSLIVTARSNELANTLAVQDFSQLKKVYGIEQAEVIIGIISSIISGQVTGEQEFRKDRESKSINSSNIFISKSTQMD
jgi:hypothetical protein